MKSINLIIVLSAIASIAQSQSIQKSVIGSSGNVTNTSGIILRSTIGETATSSYTNGVLKITQGFQQNIMANNALPITGLDFYAQRVSPSMVQLRWQTLTEINNKGFYIERKLENESDFYEANFVASQADAGNSQAPLNYEYEDANSFIGKSYYRIKQEDIDGKNSYSLIRIVHGDAAANLSLQIWPNPSTGFINVQLIGINKTNEISVLDAQGKMIRNISVENQQSYRIEGLVPGIYFVSLKSDNRIAQKIVVQ